MSQQVVTRPTVEEMVRAFVDARPEASVAPHIFIGRGQLAGASEEVEAIIGAWLERAELVDVANETAVMNEAHLDVGYMIGLELGRRLGGAR